MQARFKHKLSKMRENYLPFLRRRVAEAIIPIPPNNRNIESTFTMDAAKLEHFKKLLLSELRRHVRQVSDEQANAIDMAGDGAKESADLSLRDVISELGLKLGERDSQMIADIDQALLRMREGSYGLCVKCNKPIDERRLEAVPTARYDAACQEAIENDHLVARPSL